MTDRCVSCVRVVCRVCRVPSAAADEIESQVVFREESAGVRLFVTFLNLEASYYLQHCTGPLMETVHTLNKPLEVRRSLGHQSDLR